MILRNQYKMIFCFLLKFSVFLGWCILPAADYGVKDGRNSNQNVSQEVAEGNKVYANNRIN